MPLPLPLVQRLAISTPADAWQAIFAHAWEICSQPLAAKSAAGEVTRRDREIAGLDLFLATAGWDLWSSLATSVERTSDVLASWWAAQHGGRAVLILDALSLREVPWILQGAAERGYQIHSAKATVAELPADTTPFAKALGFGQRSSLENNGAGAVHRFPKAGTESVGVPWEDCVQFIGAQPHWVLWHHWPDSRVHDLSVAGKGIETLTQEALTQLTGEAFWLLIERLTTGRRLVITSDHGYAASGLFPDTSDEQAKYLRDLFKSGRWAPATDDTSSWVPPVDLTLSSPYGRNRYALGRRKWKSQGGYPTLAHGGLSVLEVAAPFIEISRTE
ncbi:MAG: hypothetical protein ACRERD_01545 [Candidatus Binatia bacterium]